MRLMDTTTAAVDYSDVAVMSGRSVAALSHPNVVTLFSVEADGDFHFLTMELVRGKPLDRLIPERGLDLGEILDRSAQLADGLRAAHEQGIIQKPVDPGGLTSDQITLLVTRACR